MAMLLLFPSFLRLPLCGLVQWFGKIVAVTFSLAYLPTLLVFPGVSMFFIKSPDRPARAPNLPDKIDF